MRRFNATGIDLVVNHLVMSLQRFLHRTKSSTKTIKFPLKLNISRDVSVPSLDILYAEIVYVGLTKYV